MSGREAEDLSPERKSLQSLKHGMPGPELEKHCRTPAAVYWGPLGAVPSSQVASGVWALPVWLPMPVLLH